MNRTRRKGILKLIYILKQQKNKLEDIASEEQDAYDNLPTGIKESDMGCQILINATELDSVQSELDELIDRLYELTE